MEKKLGHIIRAFEELDLKERNRMGEIYMYLDQIRYGESIKVGV